MRRRLTASRTLAQEAIAQGLVTVDGAPAFKPATQVRADQALHIAAPPRAFVSRGGEKLDHALTVFGVDPAGLHVLDAGVSTGGFTDCVLQRGAVRVVAVDVGYGQLHESLRTDPRVVLRERTNVRHLVAEDLPAPPAELLIADLSFISLALVLPGLRALLAPTARAVVLVKPQFEADRAAVADGGVVRDPRVWRAALARVADAAGGVGWEVAGATASPLLGAKGNVEFLLCLVPAEVHDGTDAEPDPGSSGVTGSAAHATTMLDAAVAEGEQRRADRRTPAGDRPRRTP